MLEKGATRMASHGSYSTGAAQVMLFVGKLSKMTFDQGMPHLFLDYCEEHVEVHKGQGLARALPRGQQFVYSMRNGVLHSQTSFCAKGPDGVKPGYLLQYPRLATGL